MQRALERALPGIDKGQISVRSRHLPVCSSSFGPTGLADGLALEVRYATALSRFAPGGRNLATFGSPAPRSTGLLGLGVNGYVNNLERAR